MRVGLIETGLEFLSIIEQEVPVGSARLVYTVSAFCLSTDLEGGVAFVEHAVAGGLTDPTARRWRQNQLLERRYRAEQALLYASRMVCISCSLCLASWFCSNLKSG